jgi:hypothetical protein
VEELIGIPEKMIPKNWKRISIEEGTRLDVYPIASIYSFIEGEQVLIGYYIERVE